MYRALEDFELLLVTGGAEEEPEIVVTGKKPPMVNLGGGYYAQIYPDGIAMVTFPGGRQAAWTYSFDANPPEVTAVFGVPPSVTLTDENITYHFLQPVPNETGPGPKTEQMPE